MGMDRDFSVRLNDRSSGHSALRGLLASSLLAATGLAVALGVGRPLTQSALGQPLNLLFPIRLSADETLTPDCVRADVVAGDARVPSGLLQLLLEGEGDASVRGVRLKSSVQIDEPIVTISLSLGCPTRFTRQYTAFIDPPSARMVALSVATLATPALDGPSGPSSGPSTGPTSVPSAQVTPATLAVVDVAPRNYSPALRAALATADAKPAALLAAKLATPSRPSDSSGPSAPMVARPPPPKPEPKQRPLARAKAPPNTSDIKSTNSRLRMDMPDRVESAGLVASAVAPSAVAPQPELLLTLSQLEALGQSLAQVQQEQRATETRLLSMRAELAQSQALQAKSERGLVWLQVLLGAAVLGLAGGCVYLWRSRRRERLLRGQQWWASGQAANQASADEGAEAAQPTSSEATQRSVKLKPMSSGPTPGLGPLVSRAIRAPLASPAAESLLHETASTAVLDTSPAPFGLQDEAPSAAADARFTDSGFASNADLPILPLPLPSPRPVAVPLTAGEELDRQVTVEELIDLEQQVDFFVVLGQDDAAIDLLQTRIDTGQANALPYLKLLELHQRRGDAVAFADLAEQFGVRFGALPPTWGMSLNQGRLLESYDNAMHALQSGWDNSVDSMALLQQLLASGSGSGSGGNRVSDGKGERGFDLPAYRDLLMLYSVARDRAELDMRSDDIDLFLPLDEPGNEGSAMMATMVWQVQPSLVINNSNELDISLDDEPIIRP